MVCRFGLKSLGTAHHAYRKLGPPVDSAPFHVLDYPDSFTAFKASSAFNSPTVNLDGGKLVNML